MVHTRLGAGGICDQAVLPIFQRFRQSPSESSSARSNEKRFTRTGMAPARVRFRIFSPDVFFALNITEARVVKGVDRPVWTEIENTGNADTWIPTGNLPARTTLNGQNLRVRNCR